MSDNIPTYTQRACTEGDYYHVDLFSYVQPPVYGNSGTPNQLIMYITRALENSGRLAYMQEEQIKHGMIKVYSNSFCWNKKHGAKLIAKVERTKIDEMKLAENKVFTLPSCDASIMKLVAKLMTEDKRILLETEELNVRLSMIFQESCVLGWTVSMTSLILPSSLCQEVTAVAMEPIERAETRASWTMEKGQVKSPSDGKFLLRESSRVIGKPMMSRYIITFCTTTVSVCHFKRELTPMKPMSRFDSKSHGAPVFQFIRERQAGSPGCKLTLISGLYSSDPRNKGNQVLKIEHSALQEQGNQWNLEVKYRLPRSNTSTTPWIDVWDFYPNAKVKVKYNYIKLTIPSPKNYHEFAVFGIPERKDKKRMQLGIFGEKPAEGKDWKIFATLFDDTMMAFEHLCDREQSRGRQLLTTLAALFVSNNDKDVQIEISALEEGWQIKGSKVKRVKSKDAWNSPENSTDFPSCVFEISHVDETKKLFSCDVTALHSNDTAKTEVLAFFEKKNETNFTGQAFMASQEMDIPEDKITEVFVFLQILTFMVGCFTGAGFAPFYQSAGSKGHHA